MSGETRTPMNPERHLQFHERQAAAMEHLMANVKPLIPKSWREARLELHVHYSPFTGTRAIQHRLTNPATTEEVQEFPESLFVASTSLHMVFTEYDQAWKQAVIELTHHVNGGFGPREASYTYDP